ncbi:hypothetical protein HDV06_000032 [Boothiomyces sp. JEL0866]|nr:hypothetical protein HDV06_000032 [Boothiomyces sp. JEL0866]
MIGSLSAPIYLITQTPLTVYFCVSSILTVISCTRSITFLNIGSIAGNRKKQNTLLNESSATVNENSDKNPDYFSRFITVLEKFYINGMYLFFGISTSLMKMFLPVYYLFSQGRQTTWAGLSIIGNVALFTLYLIAYAVNPAVSNPEKEYLKVAIYLGGFVACLFSLAAPIAIMSESIFFAFLGLSAFLTCFSFYNQTVLFALKIVPAWIKNERKLAKISNQVQQL